MTGFLIGIGLAMCVLVACLFVPIVRGPTVIDRIVAANMIGTKTTVLLIIIGTVYHRVEMFVDFALTYALLNFIGSIAAAKYFQRRARQTVEEEQS